MFPPTVVGGVNCNLESLKSIRDQNNCELESCHQSQNRHEALQTLELHQLL